MIGDRGWMSDMQERYAFYVEQQVKRERVPKPFDHFARERMFEHFVTVVRFLEIARKWEWLSQTNGVSSTHGAFGPKDLVRYLVAVRHHIERSLNALREHNGKASQLIVRYIKKDAWDYARFDVSKEEGIALVEDGQDFLYQWLTRAAIERVY